MKKYFAKLDGNLSDIDSYIGFFADSIEAAKEFADRKAEENYAQYDKPFDENDNPKFFANVEVWEDKHDAYVGDAFFTMYE